MQERIKELRTWETLNGFSLIDLVREWANCRTARIDESGDVWIEDPQVGHWISDHELDKLVEWVEGLGEDYDGES